jgi:hypothetical protein
MDFTKSGTWKAVIAGGVIIALASYIYQIYTKEPSDTVNYRPVARDFCLGAFVTATVYMFLPESIDSFIDTTTAAVVTATSVSTPADIELQTGPARF